MVPSLGEFVLLEKREQSPANLVKKELRKCLCGSDRMIGSPEDIDNRRARILTEFAKAEHVKSDEVSAVDGFASHWLVEGKRTGHCYDQSQPSRIPIWDWMRSIREDSQPPASFYFPDNLAGPDLLFGWKRSNFTDETPNDDMVLCIVQVRIPQTLLSTYSPKY